MLVQVYGPDYAVRFRSSLELNDADRVYPAVEI